MKLLGWAAVLLAWVAAPVAAPASAQNIEPAQITQASVTRLADIDFSVGGERPAAIPTEHFANRSTYRRFSVSPDGVHIAIKRVVDGETALLLMDAATQQPLKVYKLGEDQRLDWFRWAGNEKLITSISALGDYYGTPVRKNRLFVRNIENNATWMLDVDDDLLIGGDLVHVAEDGEFALIAVQRNERSQLSVYRYDLVPGAERVRVVDAQRAISNWYADDLRERVEGQVDDLDDYSPVNHAATLNRPVLLAHGSEDCRVPVSQYRMFRDATAGSPVPPRTLLIDGEGHSFSEKENEQKWYDTLLEFLAEHNPADPPPALEPAGDALAP